MHHVLLPTVKQSAFVLAVPTSLLTAPTALPAATLPELLYQQTVYIITANPKPMPIYDLRHHDSGQWGRFEVPMNIWLAAENKPDTQHWACICQVLGEEDTEHWSSWKISNEDHRNPDIVWDKWEIHIKTAMAKKPEIYGAAGSDVYNNIRPQPGTGISSLGQRVNTIATKCT